MAAILQLVDNNFLGYALELRVFSVAKVSLRHCRARADGVVSSSPRNRRSA
jgi:hypothetical protein